MLENKTIDVAAVISELKRFLWLSYAKYSLQLTQEKTV